VTTSAAHEIVLSHFSLARHHPIDDRIRLAGRYGFAGIGLYIGDYGRLEEAGEAPGRVRDLLDMHGVALREIEVVNGLGADGRGGADAAAREAIAFRMADAFGCRYLQVIGPAGDIAVAGRAFGALCDRAADHGLVVGLEFLPFTDIVDVHDARRIVEAADRPNGGICVDVWHHERGARDLAAIASLPGELITGIQVNDGTIVPEGDDYYSDCLMNRRVPGDGEFDLAGFIAAVRSTGTTAPMSFEVCSADGWASPEVHVQRIAAAARRLLS
jgi:sugar phosphate isomerase/epimerase